ncbi:MAG: DUF3987 domain-containing protein [Chloroflexota bacterium]
MEPDVPGQPRPADPSPTAETIPAEDWSARIDLLIQRREALRRGETVGPLPPMRSRPPRGLAPLPAIPPAIVADNPSPRPVSEHQPQPRADVSASGAAAPRRQPPRDAFPLEIMPDAFGALVHQGAMAFGIPPDYIGVPMLSLVAAAIGNRAHLILKEGWVEHPVIWAVVVGKPGSGKSAGLALARRPLDRLQRLARDRYEQAAAAHKQEGGTGPEPFLDHLLTSDATLEAVTDMHRRSRGLAVIRDEVAGWAASMDAYRKGGDRQTWLSLWSGGSVKVDRKTADPIILDNPAVSVCGGVQPDRLGLLLGDSRLRDGFADRFLLSAPRADPPDWTEDEIAPWTVHGAEQAFAALRPADASPIGIPFSPAAKAVWADWFRRNAESQRTTGGLEQGWLAKGPRHLARLALVLHVMERINEPDVPLDEGTLHRAIRLHDYFHAHLRRVIPEIAGALSPLEERIWQALAAAGAPGLTRTALMDALDRNVASADIRRALDRLAVICRAERIPAERGSHGPAPEIWRALKP